MARRGNVFGTERTGIMTGKEEEDEEDEERG
jgi:hypothetical protein